MSDQYDLTTKFCARPQQFAWLLGAGASASAGLPTAGDVVWDLKRRYYRREENQDIARNDLQLPAIRARIQDYMLSRGFPQDGDPGEYTRYFELIFGSDRKKQREYISALLSEKNVTLSVGNRVLAAMMANGFARAVFTTNFDTVVERAYAEVSGGSLSAYHLEGATNANLALSNEEYPFYCKLHGDFRYDSIKNLSGDLAIQNVELSKALINAANRFGFVVAGYSGRDESVMDLLRSVLATANPFPHGLFWTGRKGAGALPAVNALIEDAAKVGVDAAYVEIDTYDAFMLRLWRNLDNKNPALDAKVRKTYQGEVRIPLPEPGSGSLIRLNALPILEMPQRCQAVSFAKPKEWDDLRAASHLAEGNLIFTKADTVLCWGLLADLTEAFGDISKVEDYDLSARLVDINANLQIKGFLEEAVSKALIRGRPLLARTTRSGSTIIADRHHEDPGALEPLHKVVGKVAGPITGLMTEVDEAHPVSEQVFWAEAARVSIDIVAGRAWLAIDPDLWVWPPRAKKQAADFLDERRRNRFNSFYNKLIDAWFAILRGDAEGVAELSLAAFDAGAREENPIFRLGLRTAYTRRRT